MYTYAISSDSPRISFYLHALLRLPATFSSNNIIWVPDPAALENSVAAESEPAMTTGSPSPSEHPVEAVGARDQLGCSLGREGRRLECRRCRGEMRHYSRHQATGAPRSCSSGSGFQLPLHYPRYKREDYEKMEGWKLDLLLGEYGLRFVGSLHDKRAYAMGTFLWPNQL